MNNKWSRLVVLGTVAVAVPMLAHHPFTPDFDWQKPVTVTGKVTKVDWVAPHASLHVDAEGAGTAVQYEIELGHPAMLAKFGWSKDTVKAGQTVTVDGWQASDGRKLISAQFVTPAGGQALFGASSFFDEPYRLSKGKVGRCISAEVCVEMETKVSQR